MPEVKSRKTFLDFFPVPEFLLISTAGIGITDHHVRFVDFKKGRKKGELELVNSSTTPLPEGVIQIGFINDIPKLTEILKAIQVKFGVKYVRATLPEEKGYVFTAYITKVPQDSMRDAVAFIIEENVPVSLAKSVFEFEVIPGTENNPEVKVAVCVYPLKAIQFYESVFADAGLVPISFDSESQAIARAVVPHGDSRPYLIVNLGTFKTGLYVAEDEIVQFSSTPTIGTGTPNPEDLKNEIRRVITFWDTRLDKNGMPEKKIEKILITGVEAPNETLVQTIMSGFEIGYEVANVWVNTSEDKDKVPAVPYAESFGYGAAIGLALPNRHGHKKNV